MSHFMVLIVGENPQEQLARFKEGGKEELPKEYLEFEDKEASMLTQYKTEKIDKIMTKDMGLLNTWEAKEKGIEGKEVKIAFKKLYNTFEEFAEEWHGMKSRDEEMGRFGYWCNPNAKWDWYELGGRWTGSLKLKPGKSGMTGRLGMYDNKPANGYVDQAKKGDIDFPGMVVDGKKEAEEHWEKYQTEIKGAKDDGDKKYLGFKYGGLSGMPKTKSEYLKENTGEFSTYAVLKDGEWYEKGQMGWWGMASNEKSEARWDKELKKLLEDVSEDTLLSVYDCHI